MLKKLLPCLVLLALISDLSVQAQILKTSRETLKPIQMATGNSWGKTTNTLFKITPSDTQYWWGYYEGTEEQRTVGVHIKDTYDCAIFIPNEGIFKGATISAIRLPLLDGNFYANLKVWLSTELPSSGSASDIEVDSVAKPIGRKTGLNEVLLKKPYTLTGNGVYVGYSVDVTDVTSDESKYPIITAVGNTVAKSLFLHTSVSLPNWKDYSASGLGRLALQVLIETPAVAKSSVAISASSDWTTIADSEQSMNLNLINKGSLGIQSVDYDVTINNKVQSHHYDLATPFKGINGKVTIQVPVNTPAEVGYLKPTIRITKVNGTDNGETSANSAICPLINIRNSAPHKSVMEEFTGTWCGWCPRGIVGLTNLKNKFGDKFIGVAVHCSYSNTSGTDPMQTTTYAPVVQAFIEGFPSGLIDRVTLVDPYLGSQEGEFAFHSDIDFQKALNMPSEVELGLSSTWKDANTIDLTTSVNYYYNRTENPYRLAYIIVEDSLSGTGSTWNQTNYFSGATDYPSDLIQFIKGDQLMKGLKFNHVAHAIYDAMGIENSLTGALEVGKTMTHNFQIDITKFSCAIQDKQNLRAIVMVINSNSGRIVNAQEVKIGGQAGLNNLTEDPLSATVSNIDGILTISTNVNETANVFIYKTDGSLIASKVFAGSTNIITSGLKGTYIVRVFNSKGASVRKIVL